MKNLRNLNSINDPYFRSLIQGENKLIPFERIIFSKLDISGNVLSFSPPRQKLYPRKPSWNWTPPVLHYTRKLYFHCLRKKEKKKVKDFSLPIFCPSLPDHTAFPKLSRPTIFKRYKGLAL